MKRDAFFCIMVHEIALGCRHLTLLHTYEFGWFGGEGKTPILSFMNYVSP